jgi:predicted NBD/HSP70 family sugar kinase
MRGCIEALAGPAAVVQAARENAGLMRSVGLDTMTDGGSIASDFAAIARASRTGVESARVLLEESARRVAAAAHAIANLFDVHLIVLTGSSFAAAGDVYLPAVRDLLTRSSFARSAHPVDVRLSRSADTAAAIGGAALVLQSHLVPSSSQSSTARRSAPLSELSSLL